VSSDDAWEQRAKALKEESAHRAELVRDQEALVAAVEAVLFAHDPMGINFETNTDEYRAEAQCIVIKLRTAHNAADTTAIVHDEFARWFAPDLAGKRFRYKAIAEEIWSLWKEYEDFARS
jgi:hypothetical protein